MVRCDYVGEDFQLCFDLVELVERFGRQAALSFFRDNIWLIDGDASESWLGKESTGEVLILVHFGFPRAD